MIRFFHRWPGLIAAALLIVLALSGTVLSVFPVIERITAPADLADQTVADLAATVLAAHPGVEEIKRAPSGKITAYWFDGDTPGAAVIDPISGQDAASADPNLVERWFTDLHRALFLEDTGRLIMAATAAAMLAMAVTGAMLVAQRVGGWRRWFSRLRGPFAGRLHTELARVAVLGLGLSAITALWMTTITFDLLPSDEANPDSPAEVSGQTGLSPAEMPALLTTPVANLRELTFPAADDAEDIYTLTTDRGMGYVDQGTGELLVWADNGPWMQIEEWIYLLHTGQGASVWGMILGLMVASVPALAVTGTLIWLKSRRSAGRLRGAVAAGLAETVILVGSEGGSTWGFATSLGRALQAHGQTVHIAAMSAFAPQRYATARRIVLFAATWGDGAAPGSAKGFLDSLAKADPLLNVPMTVLGFGDKSFPGFCTYATEVAAMAQAKGWGLQMPMGQIDRQSAQDFTRWGQAFGRTMDLDLTLTHQPETPRSTALTLVSRRDYGQPEQSPAAILRFALPKATLWARMTGRAFGSFRPGDLLGILPQGSAVPRFYSLASGSADGFVEIVVRKHLHGLCSGQLIALQPGDRVQAFTRENPAFQPGPGVAPLILIGAGTGIGPLAGFLRANHTKRPAHLWFGARHPDSDFLYDEELHGWAQNGQLTSLTTAFSRTAKHHYVQDALRHDADHLRTLIAKGAKIMVCGGREMAHGVRMALADVLSPMGMTPIALKAEGRFVEDVY